MPEINKSQGSNAYEVTREVRLSKTKYCYGLQCPNLLYYKVHLKDQIPPIDPAQEARMNQGTDAGELATKQFPGGVTIQSYPLDVAVEKTKEELEKGTEYIYEAAIEVDGIHVKVDILHYKGNNQVDIYEVKASNSVKKQYLDDIGIQYYVLEKTGFKMGTANIMHLNRDYRHPEGDLWVVVDCTDDAKAKQFSIPSNLDDLWSILEQPEPPEVSIGTHCTSPYSCQMMELCWAHVPTPSILNIPGRKPWDEYKNGVLKIEDLSENFKPRGKQAKFLEAYRSGKTFVDKDQIRILLNQLEEPIYFLDFETLMQAIPEFEGGWPWQQMPFQWSIHVLENGELTHHEYLHEGKDDPRLELSKALLDVIGPKGSVVVYNQSFEKSRLIELARHFPEHMVRLQGIVDRIWDLEVPFKNQLYLDPMFLGKSSIKNVLPVMVPELKYEDLELQVGDMAGVVWQEMLDLEGEEKEKQRTALLEYCKLDTLGMVEIYRKLKEGLQ